MGTKETLHWIFFILGTLATAVGASLPGEVLSKIVMAAGGGMLAVSAKLRTSIDGSKPPTGPAAAAIVFYLLALFVVVGLAGCPHKESGIATAYKATIVVDKALREADPHVAKWFNAEKAKCARSSRGEAKAYEGCIKAHRDKARAFVALAKTNYTAQDTIRSVHLGINKADLIKVIAAVVCAVLGAGDPLGVFLPPVKAAMDKVRPLKEVSCGYR